MLELVSLRGRPDLRAQVFSDAFGALWPACVLEDPAADLFFARLHLDACRDIAFAVVGLARCGRVPLTTSLSTASRNSAASTRRTSAEA
jgi:hypothetical protein